MGSPPQDGLYAGAPPMISARPVSVRVAVRPCRLPRALVCLVALTVVSHTGAAQAARRTITLQGVVRDSATGEVLPHARVELVDLRRTAESNLDGRFALVSVPGGVHQLSVQYIGYRLLLRTSPGIWSYVSNTASSG